jgi:hypothetical protein
MFAVSKTPNRRINFHSKKLFSTLYTKAYNTQTTLSPLQIISGCITAPTPRVGKINKRATNLGDAVCSTESAEILLCCFL